MGLWPGSHARSRCQVKSVLRSTVIVMRLLVLIFPLLLGTPIVNYVDDTTLSAIKATVRALCADQPADGAWTVQERSRGFWGDAPKPSGTAARPPSPGLRDKMGAAHHANTLAVSARVKGDKGRGGLGAKPPKQMVGAPAQTQNVNVGACYGSINSHKLSQVIWPHIS